GGISSFFLQKEYPMSSFFSARTRRQICFIAIMFIASALSADSLKSVVGSDDGTSKLEKEISSIRFFEEPLFPFSGTPSIKPPSMTPSNDDDYAAKNRLIANYGKSPLRFEANQSQTDEPVKFISRGEGYNLFLTPVEAVLVLRNSKAGKSTSELSKRMDKSPSQKAKDSSTLRIRLIGANVSPLIEGKDEVSTKTNYLIGNDPSRWHTNVPNFAKVEYRDVYPGVNLIYYGDQRQLEYDFVVSPK